MTRWIFACTVLGICFIIPRYADGATWSAQPITVHEWGVQVFDGGKPDPIKDELPDFIHTDLNPGIPVPAPEKRVKDLPPDNGIRKKPVLYFYPPAEQLGDNIVGVEMRFAFGHANAWFPQVNVFRTPDMTAGAKEPDWDAWRKANAGRRFNPKNPDPIPDDPRMELVWSRLTLSKDVPAPNKLPQDTSKDHWIDAARQTQSSYVSNGSETEKFLFYEGATTEKPAFAIIPENNDPLDFSSAGAGSDIINISDKPVYNVFAIYHHDDQTWVGYLADLEPMKQSSSVSAGAGDSIASLPLPDFTKFTDWTDEKSLASLTTDRLVTALTSGGVISINHGLRDPADPQGPTQSSHLYPDEAKALEKIWHDDFFNSEGLTVVYQESPEALDAAMPLYLYTDMYHYIKLSRCGLVVNKNIDMANVYTVFSAAENLQFPDAKTHDQSIQTLKDNRLLSEGVLSYFIRARNNAKAFTDAQTMLDAK